MSPTLRSNHAVGVRLSACLALLLATASTQTPSVTLTYRAPSEDQASSGRLQLTLSTTRAARAVVWERACAVSARRDAEAPDVDADQFWTFRIDLTKDARGRAAARVRHRRVSEAGPGKEDDRTILLDGKDTLAIDAFSARTDCRYDRIQIAISGG